MNENKDNISKIKAKIAYLMTKRGTCEKYLLARHKMINASFVEMRTLAGGRMRKTPAYYLSRKVGGVTKLAYVKKSDLNIVERRALAWKYYSANLAKFSKISKEIESYFRILGVLSLDIPDRYR
ncbi:unnamed protein product [marine sediment metagenome]|uniref:Uncharacterized protein n=1 Tax=marine sediment metagenome TaxID=412755 RepID=X1FUE6_9ZZZZ